MSRRTPTEIWYEDHSDDAYANWCDTNEWDGTREEWLQTQHAWHLCQDWANDTYDDQDTERDYGR